MENLWSPESWTADVRSDSLVALAELLGAGWRVDGADLRHGPTDLAFAVAPGGWLRRGFSIGDVIALCRARKRDPAGRGATWPASVAQARPSGWVRVTPFLIAREPGDVPPGFRLPSEAELEWVLRGFGPGRWLGLEPNATLSTKNRLSIRESLVAPLGLDGVIDRFQRCQDDWHESYQGAPATSEPWGEGAEVGRECHTFWQDADEELIGLHAANRTAGSDGAERAVLSLGGWLDDPGVGTPRGDAEDEGVNELIGLLQANRKLAFRVLAVLADAPGDELAALVEPLVDDAASAKPSEAARALSWIARVALGATHDRLHRGLAKAVSASLDGLVCLLEHAKPAVRAAASMAVAASADRTDEALKALSARGAVERSKTVKASLVLAASVLMRATGREGVPLESVAAPAPERALADAIAGRPDVDRLVAALDGKPTKGVPFFDGDIGPALFEQLAHAAGPRSEALAERLWRSKKLEAGIRLAFSTATPEQMHVPDDLSGLQREMLEYTIDVEWLPVSGLPGSAAARELVLGRRSEPALEWLVEIDGRPLPFYLALFELAARTDQRSVHLAAVEPLLEGLSLDRFLAMDEATKSIAELRGAKRGRQVAPWPYVDSVAFANHVAAGPVAEREVYAAELAELVREELARLQDKAAAEGRRPVARYGSPAVSALRRLAACYGADLQPPRELVELIVETVRLNSIPHGLLGPLGGMAWIYDQTFENAKTVVEAFIAGKDVPDGLVPPDSGPDWPDWVVHAAVCHELAIAWNHTMDALSYPESRAVRERLPKEVLYLYDREGQPRDDRGFTDPEVRREALRAIWPDVMRRAAEARC